MPKPSGPKTREGEVFRTRLHPASCAGAWTLAGFILFVGTLIVRHNELPRATNARVVAVSLILAVAATIGPLRRLRRSELVLTPSVLRVRLRTWREHVADVPLHEVRSVDVRSTALGRRLDFGTVHVLRADGDVLAVAHVRGATRLRDALRRAGVRR